MIQYYYVLALKARTDYMFCAGFFHTRKNLKNFSKEVIKSHLAVLIWCGKRDKHFSNHKGKEVRLMKPSDFQKTVQCRFESCLKKVVRSVVKDYYKELNRRKNKEISFSELPDVLVDKMAVWDDYETDYTIFSVCGIDIRVLDDELAEALKKLPERKRNTLLMYYFLEMTESEIANLQKITQSGVFRNRHHALETMKKILKEEHKKMKQLFKKPSYYLISSAMDGNEKAIEKLLAFYDPYISKCCLRSLYDEYGNVYIVVDMELKGRIREALIKMILGFDIEDMDLEPEE